MVHIIAKSMHIFSSEDISIVIPQRTCLLNNQLTQSNSLIQLFYPHGQHNQTLIECLVDERRMLHIMKAHNLLGPTHETGDEQNWPGWPIVTTGTGAKRIEGLWAWSKEKSRAYQRPNGRWKSFDAEVRSRNSSKLEKSMDSSSDRELFGDSWGKL